ncbi:hypothetical protein [Methanosarcina sp.]|mgnify:CR=1 FL=1|uniref:hypothetical protein n=1 Tax=Methanosarcina sp. TaxID=2213 RepID=UPI002C60F53B|nr:hypothetical protein [Methanosarcina sp.]HOW15416.1 hypothetical protein [Methanosarcina sp.]
MVEEDIVKHLEFIQNIITRMANNSFLLKGWTVTLVVALFALAAQNSNSKFVILAFFPVLTFWILDAFYLWQERLFRALYNDIRNKTKDSILYEGPFTLDTTSYKGKVQSWARTAISKTLVIFYGIMIIAICIAMLILRVI